MSPALSTFLFEAVNFLVLAAALGWVFVKPVRGALEAERAQHARQEQQAAERLAEAERIRAEVQAQRAALRQELDRMRGEARAAAAEHAETVLAEARARAEQEREALRRELHRQEQSWRQEMQEEAASVAAQAVMRLLEWLGGPELETALARAACHELQPPPGAGLGHVVVESARPLPSEARELVASALAGAASVRYRTAPELGSGLRILTEAGMVDASASGMAAYARHTLASRLEAPVQEGAPAHG